MPYSLYIITNKINGKEYVGITSRTPSERWSSHVYQSKLSHGRGRPLYSAIKKYGVNNFEFYVVAEAVSFSALKEAEIIVISERQSRVPNGYNMTYGGDGTLGFKLSAAQIKKMISSRGHFKHTEEAKRKISLAGMGRRHAERTREKLSLFRKKYYADNPDKAAQSSIAILSWARSDDGRKLLSEKIKAQLLNPEFEKFRDQTGRKRNEVTKDKMRQSKAQLFSEGAHTKQRKSGLTLEVVSYVKALAVAKVFSNRAIGRRFNVPTSHVCYIAKGVCWKDAEASSLDAAIAAYNDPTFSAERISQAFSRGAPRHAIHAK